MATDEFLEDKAAEMRANPTKAERYLRSQLTVGSGWSFQVLRFTNREIYQRQGWVMDCIERRLNVIRKLKGLPVVVRVKPNYHIPNRKPIVPLVLGSYRNKRR